MTTTERSELNLLREDNARALELLRSTRTLIEKVNAEPQQRGTHTQLRMHSERIGSTIAELESR